MPRGFGRGSGPDGGHRTAHPGHGASISHHRRHAGIGGQEGTAARHRLRRGNLPAPGARRHAHGYLRARRGSVVRSEHSLGFRPGLAAERPRADRTQPRGGIRAFSGAWRRRNPESGERTVHLRARRQSAGGSRPGPQEFLGRLRRHGGIQPGRRRGTGLVAVDGGRRPRPRHLGHGRRALRRLDDAGLYQCKSA